MFMSSVRLRTGERGGTGALAAFLAGSVASIGQVHHLVWSLFGDKDGERDFLYRMTGRGPSEPILVYSPEPVSDPHGIWKAESRPFVLADRLVAGDRLAWAIRVNATVKTGSRRHDLVTHARHGGDDSHRDDIAQRVVPPWLEPKLADAGLQAPAGIMAVEAHISRRFQHDLRARGNPITLGTTDVRGTGVVTDAVALRKALAAGIGSGRAYGCGMLLIRRLA